MSRKIYIIIAVVLTVVLSVSTFFIIRNHIDSAKQNEVYDNLAEIVEDEPPKENEGVTFSEDKDYLAEYLELYRQNEDMVGWIKVEDTNINYPVVQSVNEPNFYLKHKFDKSKPKILDGHSKGIRFRTQKHRYTPYRQDDIHISHLAIFPLLQVLFRLVPAPVVH